jgi:hypothetical protein
VEKAIRAREACCRVEGQGGRRAGELPMRRTNRDLEGEWISVRIDAQQSNRDRLSSRSSYE